MKNIIKNSKKYRHEDTEEHTLLNATRSIQLYTLYKMWTISVILHITANYLFALFNY